MALHNPQVQASFFPVVSNAVPALFLAAPHPSSDPSACASPVPGLSVLLDNEPPKGREVLVTAVSQLCLAWGQVQGMDSVDVY